MKIPDNLDDLEEIYSTAHEKWPEGYISASKGAKPILEFDWRKKKGIESIFSKGMFLKDKNFDQLPDELDLKIAFPKKCDLSVLTAACNFAFRFGMETTAYEGPIVAEEDWKGNLLIFEEDSECGMELIENEGRKVVRIHGQGEELERFSSRICEHFPLLPEGRTWKDNLQDITDGFAMKNLDGQLAYLKAYEQELEGNIKAYVSPKINYSLNKIQTAFPRVEFKNHKEGKKIYEKSYDVPWEVSVFKRILDEKVYSRLKPDDQVKIYGVLSEDKDVRNNLAHEIDEVLRERCAVSNTDFMLL